jgi:hypothetical protein
MGGRENELVDRIVGTLGVDDVCAASPRFMNPEKHPLSIECNSTKRRRFMHMY